ncbi:MAG: IS3 family transposase [Ignavibacteria bacterium]|nr:IS3 family transposase [Ignavibacteria bacterium]
MFGLSRQSYYKRKHAERRKAEEAAQVVEMVQGVRNRMPRLGTRKLHALLREKFGEEHLRIGRDKLFAILGQENMLQRRRKRYLQTTDSKHWMRKYPNLIKELTITRKEQVWVSDITYVRTAEGFCYLSMITDVYSRKIVGSAVSSSLSSEICIAALQEALRTRETDKKLIHHSDRGIQYCSKEYVYILQKNDIGINMTENGDPYENALAERMNRTIKEEFFGEHRFSDRAFLSMVVRESVGIYNRERPHLSLGMQAPEAVHFGANK